MTVTGRKIMNQAMTASMVLATALVLIPLGFIFFHIVSMGMSAITPDFFTQIPKPPGETGGGIANGMVGSLIVIAGASLIGVPIGILGAVYLSEYGSGYAATVIRFSADVLSGIPTIITGLIVYGLVVVPMKGFSAIAGSIALSLIMIPIVLRTTEEQLKLVPVTIREASLALGVPVWRTTLKVTLVCAKNGIITGILLSVARIAGETAPLLFTALGNLLWSKSLGEPIATLPLQIFNFAISPYEDWHKLAWGGALVLVVVMFSVSLTARYFNRSRF